MLDKWNNQDYRNLTLKKAFTDFTSIYHPKHAPAISDVFGKITSEELPLAETSLEDITQYLNNSLENDANRFTKYKDRKTWFGNMVADTNLYPGFYVLGEISSLGKTTFVFQLSVAGEHIFYFSLGQ